MTRCKSYAEAELPIGEVVPCRCGLVHGVEEIAAGPATRAATRKETSDHSGCRYVLAYESYSA